MISHLRACLTFLICMLSLQLFNTQAITPPQSLNTPSEGFCRGLYVKTNAPSWFALVPNIAVEADVAPRLSFNLPFYYSGWDFFRSDVKLRNLTLMPEIRVWADPANTHLFVNAHFGLAWYNLAFGGSHRYQDHDRRSPAVGGGLGIGYRFSFCRNPRWQMEAAIGCGLYRLDYDIWQNRDNGLLEGRRKRTFFGIDQAALSFSYNFGKARKGGAR